MDPQSGSRYGWLLGGLGSLLWLAILGAVRLYHGDALGAAGGFGFFGVGVAYVLLAAPWRLPRTPFWRLYLGFLVILLGGAAFMVWHCLPPEEARPLLGVAVLPIVFPLLLPLFIIGRRRWVDEAAAAEPPPAAEAEAAAPAGGQEADEAPQA
jgi:hypothetical protein